MNHSPLAIRLRVTISGIDDYDKITSSKKIFCIIESRDKESKPLPIRKSELESITCILSEAKVELLDNTESGVIAIELSECYKVIRILEERGYKFLDKIPYSVYQYLASYLSSSHNTISMQDIEAKVGTELWQKLKPFQQTSVRQMINHKSYYNASEMGVGKTLQAATVSVYFKQDTLIICPSTLRYTWKSELMKWLGLKEEEIFVCKSTKDIYKLTDFDIKSIPKEKKTKKQMKKPTKPFKEPKKKIKPGRYFIISYSLTAKHEIKHYLHQKKFHTIILDEAHNIKNPRAKRTLACLFIGEPSSVKILLSGTPFSYPSELFTQIKFIHPEIYPIFHDFKKGIESPDQFFFANRYCQPKLIKLGFRSEWIFKGYKNHEELNAVLSTMMIRHKKTDVLPQLPAHNRSCVILEPLSVKHQKEITKLLTEESKDDGDGKEKKKQTKKQSEILLANKNNETKNEKENKTEKEKKDENKNEQEEKTDEQTEKPPRPISERERYMAAFRLTCQYKLDNTLNYLKEYVIGNLLKLDPTLNILVFAHHAKTQEAIAELFREQNIPFFQIEKSTSLIQRKKYEDIFQGPKNKYRVGVLSLTAASSGLTLTSAATQIFTEVLFGPDIHLQAEARAWRMGAVRLVNTIYLMQPNTTDDINFGLIQKKERESTRIMDNEPHKITARRFKVGESINLLEEQQFRKRNRKPKENDETKEDPEPKRQRIITKRKLEAKLELQQEKKELD